MMKNYIQQIIELFGHNEYSLATRRKVQRWLADDNHAEEKKEALHTLWQQAGEQKVPRGMQQSILRMQQNLGMQSVGSGKKYQLLIWRAAAIFLLAVSSVSIYLMLEKDKPQKDLVECFIPTAEIRELTLPDGTRVMLNSRSTLLYPEQFADIDPVEKAGEIFTALLGTNPYEDLKEAGYEFRPIQLGE